MKHKIIIANKEYTMPKMSADEYMDYLEASEKINETSETGYKKTHIELMCDWIVRLYGNQFTVEELKNPETGLTVDGIIAEFMVVDLDVAGKVQERMEKIGKNFTEGK